MRVAAFIHRHYSPAAGESPLGHVAATLAGLLLIIGGGALVTSIEVLPLGVVLGLLGIMLLAVGIVGHIRSGIGLGDALDTVVGLAGAAITMTFVLAVAAVVIGFAFTVVFAIVQWIIA